jgi:hypothetical protein
MRILKRIKVENDVLEIRQIPMLGIVAVFSSHQINGPVTPWYRNYLSVPVEIRRLFRAYEVAR